MKAPVKIGDLRHRIVIERGARTSDEGGGSTTEWQPVAEVWAAIWSRNVGEVFASGRVSGTATHDVWIRYRADVQPDMRIVFGDRVFDILGAIDVEDRAAWLKCPVEERDL
jgi:SPP1 family predicted phage head-tail adaptor